MMPNLSAQISPRAFVSLALGISSVFCFLTLLTGIPALLVGFSALREINEGEGRIKGRAAALAGMVLGGLGTLVAVAGLFAMVIMSIRGASERTVCQNRLRQLGSALGAYYGKEKSLPPGTVPNPKLPPEERLSWDVTLLPF